MMTDKAPADSRLRWRVEDGDIWQGKGGTQEFLVVECHSHEMQEMGYDIADTTDCEALPLTHYEYHEFEL